METFWKVLEYVQQGGWVMIPLGITSLALWLLVAERLGAFRALTRGDLKLQDAIRAIDGEPVPNRGSGLRLWLVESFLAKRVGNVALDRQILRECSMRIEPTLTRSIATIGVLAAIAPLLGLLGTVIGMIETFNVISVFGTGNAKAMAGGISVALVTTQSGLLVAIPGLFASAALARKASKLKKNLEETTVVLDHHIKTAFENGGQH